MSTKSKIYREFLYPALLILGFICIHSATIFTNQTLSPPKSIHHGPVPSINNKFLLEKDLSTQGNFLYQYYTADPWGLSHHSPYEKHILEHQLKLEIPGFNSFALLGNPMVSEFWWGIFYPLNQIKSLLPESYWDFYPGLHLLLLSIAVYFLTLLTIGDRRSAFFAGLITNGIGFLLIYFSAEELINPMPWGIILIISLELIYKEKFLLSFLLSFIASYGLGTSGHPVLFLIWGITYFIYLTIRIASDRIKIKFLIAYLFFIAFGLISAGPNIFTFIHYVVSYGALSTSTFAEPQF